MPISSGPDNARVMIVGEAPGAQEESTRQPFVGASGFELTKLLLEVGIQRNSCYITNVTSIRPPGNDIDLFFCGKREAALLGITPFANKYPRPELQVGMQELYDAIRRVRPQIIIALGNTPLWAICGESGIMAWRGSYMRTHAGIGYDCDVIPTIHPANILRDWSNRFLVQKDMQRVARALRDGSAPKRPDYNFTVAPTFDGVMDRLNTWRGGRFAEDIETRRGQIACVGIARDTNEALCIPFISAAKRDAYWHEEEELQIILKLREFNTRPDTELIFHNGSYDCQYFAKQWGYCPNIKHDTMIKQHVAFAGLRKSLNVCSSLYCHYHRYWKEDGKEWNEGLDERQLWAYNCEDCVRTYEVDESLEEIIRLLGLQEQYRFQIDDLFPEVFRTMLRGVRIDLNKRAAFDMRLEQDMMAIDKWFQRVLGHPLNPRSPQQIGRLLYEDLGVPPIKKRGTGRLTTEDEALEKIKGKYPLLRPLLSKISDYRSLGVYRSTFVQAELSDDERMRCSYNLAGTETFRFSSSEDAFGTGTNLQNIPAGDE